MDSVIYEESPRYDSLFKAIMVLPVFFIVAGIYYLITVEVEAAIGMFALTLLMAATYWAIFPRKYLILDSKIKIVLGGPSSFNIPFDNLETAREPEGGKLRHQLRHLLLRQAHCGNHQKKGVKGKYNSKQPRAVP